MVSNIFYFHPYLGKIPILTDIFQMGWFNHQLVKHHHWVYFFGVAPFGAEPRLGGMVPNLGGLLDRGLKPELFGDLGAIDVGDVKR